MIAELDVEEYAGQPPELGGVIVGEEVGCCADVDPTDDINADEWVSLVDAGGEPRPGRAA